MSVYVSTLQAPYLYEYYALQCSNRTHYYNLSSNLEYQSIRFRAAVSASNNLCRDKLSGAIRPIQDSHLLLSLPLYSTLQVLFPTILALCALSIFRKGLIYLPLATLVRNLSLQSIFVSLLPPIAMQFSIVTTRAV